MDNRKPETRSWARITFALMWRGIKQDWHSWRIQRNFAALGTHLLAANAHIHTMKMYPFLARVWLAEEKVSVIRNEAELERAMKGWRRELGLPPEPEKAKDGK